MKKSYAIVSEKRAEREFGRLPMQIRRRISDAIAALSDDPRPPGCKKMAGSWGAWRIRVGHYRVVYDVDDEKMRVLILRVGNRNDIYR